jgi:RimJ/RimL family protein N-acetyltransferase
MMLQTDRLRLRGWRDDDVDAYAELHGDPHVAYWLGGRMSYEQALASLQRNREGIEARGWGLYALERKEDGALLGVAGLAPVDPEIPLAPAVEASWRLSPAAWGRGYCTEAMRAVLADAFDRGEQEVVSFTAESNRRSRALVERLGFTRDEASDFGHPRLPPDHSLHRHVVYRLSRPG